MLFRKQLRQRLLIHFLGSGDKIRSHDFAYGLIFVRRHQTAQRHDSQQVLFGIQHVCVVNGFNLLGLAAQIGDGLIHRHLRTKTRETRTHQTTGIVFGIGEKRDHFASGIVVE